MLVQVPDDARGLVRDEAALARERRAAQRADRRGRALRALLRGPGRRAGGPAVVPGRAVLAVLAVVAVPAALFLLLGPAADPVERPLPLASPAVAAGAVGGLLPPVLLRGGDGDPLPARDTARPGVLVLLPDGCGCDALVQDVLRQARQFTRGVRVVVPGPGAEQEAERLRTEVLRGVPAAVDPDGGLAASTAARGLTVLVVAADGVVREVVRDVRPGSRLEGDLDVLR